VAKGLADLGLGLSVYAPAYLPLSSVSDIGFTTKDAYAHLHACKDLFETFAPYREEYEKNNLVPVAWIASEPTLLGSKNPIQGLSDMKGKKIRVTSYLANSIRALGGSPIALSGSEVYEALERGTIDAYTGANMRYAAAMKFYEAAKYFTDPGFGTYVTINLLMNRAVWSKMSDTCKAAFEKATGEFHDAQIHAINKANIKNAHAFVDNGAIPILLSKEELTRIRETAAPVVERAWIDDISKRNLPAEETLAKFKTLAKKYEPQSTYKDAFSLAVELYKK
jgi:TRAP-type C4-dicarboxylate transport system substrate-binding protein